MLEQPGAGNLLDSARDVILRELLPHLPEAQRYQARMVASALAIARREGEARPEPVLAALRSLLREPAGAAPDLLAALSRAIRGGAYDPGTADHAACAALLLALVRLRCEVSAPRALEARSPS